MSDPSVAVNVPPFDPANPLTAPLPAQLVTGVVPTADGRQLLAVCIRTPAGTTTAFLTEAEASEWETTIRATRRKMSRIIVPTTLPIPHPLVLRQANGQG